MKEYMFEIISVCYIILLCGIFFGATYISNKQHNSCVVEVIKLGQSKDVAVNLCR